MALAELPDDILRYVLFPFVTKADRFELNQTLPSNHRVIGKLGKMVLEFELLWITNKMKRTVNKCVTISDISVKRESILDWLRDYKSYSILFQYSHKVRCSFVRQVNFLIDHDQSTYKTEEYVVELNRLRKEIFNAMLSQYRYKYEMVHNNGNLPSYR